MGACSQLNGGVSSPHTSACNHLLIVLIGMRYVIPSEGLMAGFVYSRPDVEKNKI